MPKPKPKKKVFDNLDTLAKHGIGPGAKKKVFDNLDTLEKHGLAGPVTKERVTEALNPKPKKKLPEPDAVFRNLDTLAKHGLVTGEHVTEALNPKPLKFTPEQIAKAVEEPKIASSPTNLARAVRKLKKREHEA